MEAHVNSLPFSNLLSNIFPPAFQASMIVVVVRRDQMDEDQQIVQVHSQWEEGRGRGERE